MCGLMLAVLVERSSCGARFSKRRAGGESGLTLPPKVPNPCFLHRADHPTRSGRFADTWPGAAGPGVAGGFNALAPTDVYARNEVIG